MALDIKAPETERLAAEVAALAGESKTGAARTALRERRDRLRLRGAQGDRASVRRFLEREAWPQVPAEARGTPLQRAEREAILGFGKGRHPAALNFGDCMAYATANVAGQPLLCLGDDFASTDLPLVTL